MSIASERAIAVPVSAYCKASLFGKREWRPFPKSSDDGVGVRAEASDTASPRTLTVATYNVWFESMLNEMRYPAILKLLSSTGADVVCPQEVNQSFLRHLKADAGVRASYAVLGVQGETIRGGAFHGCLMLVRRRTLTVAGGTLEQLPASRNGRSLLSARITSITGQPTEGIRDLTIATAHLESPGADYAESARRAQLEYVKARLPPGGAVFCGDLNLSGAGEAHLPESLGFRDAWIEAGNAPDTPTSDSLYKSAYPPRRIDRVLFTGDGAARAIEAALFGETPLKLTEPIQTDLYLSDHKGVLVKLRL